MREQRPSACHGAFWQYEQDGHWYAFTPEGSEQMNRAYLAYIHDAQSCRSETIVAGGVARVVDFEQMTQQHAKTMKLRNIRLWTGVPAHWESDPAVLLTQGGYVASLYVEVTDSKILEWVEYILRHTGHASDKSSDCSRMENAKVVSVHRIENFRLWHRYQARLAAMREDHAKYNVSVQGTSLDLDGRHGAMSQSQSALDCGVPLASDVDETYCWLVGNEGIRYPI